MAMPPNNLEAMEARRRAAEAASAVLGHDITQNFVEQQRQEEYQQAHMEAMQRAYEYQQHQQAIVQAAGDYAPVDGNYANGYAQPAQGAAAQPSKPKRPKVKANRVVGAQKWHDSTLDEWDPNDYRIFCGDLGNETSDEVLAKAFKHYPSFQKAKVIKDKASGKTKGYGFVSFKEGRDYLKALKEMQGKYIGNRPVKLSKSTWKQRSVETKSKKKKSKK
ncbi:uncharacterized protein MONBRDRAFT_32320 [Monosiga brevicollis MX1]|uniref:RRM domain-containing protein n=1 Tax=Monosiga brevicollis TaxID=81824 RepID=A9UYS2_MONBE|nr:uncharacterized protein MONBRDRAFT_32320 [Monosiga brevicollis MX1]EDQ89513.1 predicted protein [Monosiga brevicollis MX1]|eukprot:XP_001745542.1 hypothetical protein [Monosiga brevicollis MX1]